MNRMELKRAFEEGLISEEKYKESLFSIETAPRQARKPKRVFEGITEEEFIKLVKATRKWKHRIIYFLGYGAGLRLSEMVGRKNPDGTWKIKPIQRDAFDFKLRRILIHGKGSKDRYVNIPRFFKEKYLRAIPFKLERRAIESAFLRNSYRAGINQVIGTYKTKNGDVPINRLKIHSLRRGYCQNLFKKKLALNTIQALMGHENLATTSRYSNVKGMDAVQAAIDAGL